MAENTVLCTGAPRRHADQTYSEGVLAYPLTILRGLAWPGNGSRRALGTLGITSCRGGEGVSTVAVQLAVAAASCGNGRVLVVDANLEHPSLPRMLAVAAAPGLAEVVRGELPLERVLGCCAVDNLSVLPAGRVLGGAAQVYDSTRLGELLEVLRGDFGLVVFDLPPAGQASAAIRLAGLLDGVLLVVEAEKVRWEAAQRTKELLARAEARLLGAVLNKRRQHIPGWLYRQL